MLYESLENRQMFSQSPILPATAGALPDAGGNSPAEAPVVALVVGQKHVVADSVGAGDADDFYRITVGQDVTLKASVKAAKGGAQLTLLNADGASVAQGKLKSVRGALEAGDYFLKVHSPQDAPASYKLSFQAKAARRPQASMLPGRPFQVPAEATPTDTAHTDLPVADPPETDLPGADVPVSETTPTDAVPTTPPPSLSAPPMLPAPGGIPSLPLGFGSAARPSSASAPARPASQSAHDHGSLVCNATHTGSTSGHSAPSPASADRATQPSAAAAGPLQAAGVGIEAGSFYVATDGTLKIHAPRAVNASLVDASSGTDTVSWLPLVYRWDVTTGAWSAPQWVQDAAGTADWTQGTLTSANNGFPAWGAKSYVQPTQDGGAVASLTLEYAGWYYVENRVHFASTGEYYQDASEALQATPGYPNLVYVSPAGGSVGTGNGSDARKVLYVNFEGATIARGDLLRYAGDWGYGADILDAAQDGIRVDPYLAGNAEREQIISTATTMLQQDLAPFGVTVVRWNGPAVENQRVTTIFVGNSTVTDALGQDGFAARGNIACDLDSGNDNLTDIAFADEEWHGSSWNTAVVMADMLLHEAGHTFGLSHVRTEGALESMGWGYDYPLNRVQDTSYTDRDLVITDGTYAGYTQNAYRTVMAAFA